MVTESLISIIIPVYKVEKYIDRCMNSLVNQTWKNIEIILIDDGSPDKSGILCDKWAEKDKRVKVLHKLNGGVSSARNEGLKIAQGQYVGFIDPDDFVEIDTYEFLYKTLTDNDALISVVGWDNYLESDNDRLDLLSWKPVSFFDTIDCINAINREIYNRISLTWNKLFSRTVIDGLFYDENYINGEDRLYCIKAIAKGAELGGKIAYNMLPKYHYLQRKNSAGNKNFTPKDATLIPLCEEIIEIVKRYAPSAVSVANAQLSNSYFQLINMLDKTPNEYPEIRDELMKNFRKRFPRFLLEKNNFRRKIALLLFFINPTIYSSLGKIYRKIKGIKSF